MSESKQKRGMAMIVPSRRRLVMEARGALSTASEAMAQAEAQHGLLVEASRKLLDELEVYFMRSSVEASSSVVAAMEALGSELRLEKEEVIGEPLKMADYDPHPVPRRSGRPRRGGS